MDKSILKQSIIDLLKEDDDFKKTLISILQEDFLSQIEIRQDYQSAHVMSGYHEDGPEISVISDIYSPSIIFSNFDLENKMKFSDYKKLLSEKIANTITFSDKKSVIKFFTMRCFNVIIPKIAYHETPTLEEFEFKVDSCIQIIKKSGFNTTEKSMRTHGVDVFEESY